jgi:hypothetical protein
MKGFYCISQEKSGLESICMCLKLRSGKAPYAEESNDAPLSQFISLNIARFLEKNLFCVHKSH